MKSQSLYQKAYWVANDIQVLFIRSLKHIYKNYDQLLGLTIQPIMFMLLFRYVLGGAILVEEGTYINFLMAGILVQGVAFGSLTTSYSIAMDLQRGIIDRLKTLPIASWAVMMGHVAGDLVRNTLQAVIIIFMGLLVGFHSTASVSDWIVIAVLVFLFTLAVSWMAAIMGLAAKTLESVSWIGFLVMFPLTFASAAFVPTKTMPPVLRTFAENQPVTHIVEAIRALTLGKSAGHHLWFALVWCMAIIIISIPVAAYLFRRHGGK